MSGAVSLERPVGAPVLRELHGRVGGEPDRVFAMLVERIGPSAADTASRRAVVQGGYWYRGEYAVESDGAGSAVTLTIVNVAPGWRLLGRVTGTGVLRDAPRAFADLLGALSSA